MPRRRFAAPLLAALTLLGCQAGDDVVAPAAGALELTSEQVGSPDDPDGITVALDDGEGRPLLPGESLLLPGLPIGRHILAVDGVAPGCALDGPNPRPVTVFPDSTVAVAFHLTCLGTPATGTLLIAVSTGGVDLDPDGYTVFVDALEPRPLAEGDTVSFPTLAEGGHAVRLGGVAANCTVAGDNPRRAELTAQDTLTVVWDVGCRPPASGRIAFTREPFGEVGRHLFLVQADGTGLTQLTFVSSDFDDDPVWSPDGTRLAVVTESSNPLVPIRLSIIRPDDGIVIPLPVEPLFPFDVRWSPDGSRLSINDYDSSERQYHVYLIAADGTTPYQRLVEMGSEAGGAWSPDGGTIVFLGGQSDTTPNRLYLTDPAGTSPRQITPDTLALGPKSRDLEWSPDGSRIVFVGPQALGEEFGTDIYVVGADGSGLRNLTRSAPFTANTEPRWSGDGRRIAFVCSIALDAAGNLSDICDVSPDGGPVARLTHSPATYEGLRWSPDGSRLVFVRPDSSDRFLGRPDLFIMNGDGSGVVRLTHSADSEGSPSWGP